MPTQTFINSKAKGTEAEDFVINVFEARGYELVHRAEDYFPDYDFAAMNRQGEIKTVEVKYDTKAERTGNFYLDLVALNHSKADILIICWGQPIKALYFLEMEKARKLANEWPVKINAGEFHEAGVLINKRMFLETFQPKIVKVSI